MAKEKKEFKKFRNIFKNLVIERPIKAKLVKVPRFPKATLCRAGDRVVDEKFSPGQIQTIGPDGKDAWVRYERTKSSWSCLKRLSDLRLVKRAVN